VIRPNILNTFNTFIIEIAQAHKKATGCPPPKKVVRFFDNLLDLLFPEFSVSRYTDEIAVSEKIDILKEELRDLLDKNTECMKSREEGIVDTIFNEIPAIRSKLLLDIDAIFMGDPAAKSREEVIRSYPGFYAIASYRFAHQLVVLGIKLIPRIISENAHRRTGIDIHPGAKIGEYCCIDHGTGIVIGETAEIGSHVKIYQGVTLGGLSVNKEDARKKRHPTIEDNVVLYAGATILGGDTVIGKGSIIGGNVWLTKSIPPGSKIYYQAKMTNTQGDMDMITVK
jgi:serine O-acetyltransferase